MTTPTSSARSSIASCGIDQPSCASSAGRSRACLTERRRISGRPISPYRASRSCSTIRVDTNATVPAGLDRDDRERAHHFGGGSLEPHQLVPCPLYPAHTHHLRWSAFRWMVGKNLCCDITSSDRARSGWPRVKPIPPLFEQELLSEPDAVGVRAFPRAESMTVDVVADQTPGGLSALTTDLFHLRALGSSP
jgi:hypothetical protein